MENTLYLLLVGALVGMASSYLGSFMVLKRMSLVGDALSHVALPGIAIALAFGINPMLGAFFALVLATFGIWYLGEHTTVYPDAIVGVFFTASLSLGLILTPEPELLEALFGSIDNISMVDGVMAIGGSLVILLITYLISKKLLLGVVSDDLAKSQGVKINRVNLIYLILVGMVVALGVKFLGTLLTGAMVIIPAAASKNLSGSIRQFQTLSVIFGVFASVLGILAAKSTDVASGPIVVLTAVIIFLISLAFRRK